MAASKPYFEVVTVAGSGQRGHLSSPVPVESSAADFCKAYGIAADANKNLYVTNYGSHCIYIIEKGSVRLYAGVAKQVGKEYEGGHRNGPVTTALFSRPQDLLYYPKEDVIFVADYENERIRRINLQERTVADEIGCPAGNPSALALHPDSGDIFISCSFISHCVYVYRRSTRVITMIAGQNGQGFTNGPGLKSLFFDPISIAFDSTRSTLLVCDSGNHCIRQVNITADPGSGELIAGTVTTFAGVAGVAGYADGGLSKALFNAPHGVRIDSKGSVFVADSKNRCIRQIVGNRVFTVAGGLGRAEAGLADGPVLNQAMFKHPTSILIDELSEEMIICDTSNEQIRSFKLICNPPPLIQYGWNECLNWLREPAKVSDARVMYLTGLTFGIELEALLESLKRNKFPNLQKMFLSECSLDGLIGHPKLEHFFTEPRLSLLHNYTPSTCVDFSNRQLSEKLFTSKSTSSSSWQSLVGGLRPRNPDCLILSADFSTNRFKTFDLGASNLNRLETRNSLLFVTKLDLSNNLLTSIARLLALGDLTDLNLTNNKLADLPLEASVRWKFLRNLNLSRNRLTTLESICHLRSLQSLQVSGNQLTRLPFNLPTTIKKLEMSNNPLVPPFDVVTSLGLDQTLQYLDELKHGQTPWKQVKVVLCGKEGVGKTHLSRRLQGLTYNENRSTDGVEMSMMTLGTTSAQLCIYDFGGQEVFYGTHEFFLSGQAIYLIVFNSTKPDRANIEYWFNNLQEKDGVKIILVGTFTDELSATQLASVKTEMAEFIKKLSKAASKPIPRTAYVSSTTKYFSNGILEVREALQQTIDANDSTFLFNKPVPNFYQASCEQLAVQRKSFPFMTMAQFKELVVPRNTSHDSVVLMATIFHQAGVITWFDLPVLRDIVVLDPQWLADLMACLVSFKTNWKDGLVTRGDLDQVWKDSNRFPHHLIPSFIRLLENLELLFSFRHKGNEWLLPCMLPREKSEAYIMHTRRLESGDIDPAYFKIYRELSFTFAPKGLFSKLIFKLMNIDNMTMVASWLNGIILQSKGSGRQDAPDEQILLELTETPKAKKIIIIALILKDKVDVTLFAHAMECLAQLRRLHSSFQHKWDLTTSCEHCIATRKDFMTMETKCMLSVKDIEREFSKNETIKCPSHFIKLRLSRLAPDRCLTHIMDLTGGVEEVKAPSLGIGGQGVVVKGQLLGSGQFVAVKQPNTLFDDWHKEVFIMAQLDHPNLVKLHGYIKASPPKLVMEFCDQGDLTKFMKHHPQLPWKQRVQLLLDIARGVAELHRQVPPIIHRDLRDVNVMISTKKEDGVAKFVAKVGDFGLSVTADVHNTERFGNWEWIAPETLKLGGGVSQSKVIYTEMYDVYSFGIIIWCLAHPGQMPFRELGAPEVAKEAIVKDHKRPGFTIDINSANLEAIKFMQALASECWQPNPSHRPTFGQIVHRLEQFLQAPEPAPPAIEAPVTPSSSGQIAVEAAVEEIPQQAPETGKSVRTTAESSATSLVPALQVPSPRTPVAVPTEIPTLEEIQRKAQALLAKEGTLALPASESDADFFASLADRLRNAAADNSIRSRPTRGEIFLQFLDNFLK